VPKCLTFCLSCHSLVQVTCGSRIEDLGCKVKLVLFKTTHKGWGVKADQEIAEGTFVCLYAAKVR
jgi:hypothetical protein